MHKYSPFQISQLITENPGKLSPFGLIKEEFEQGSHPSTKKFWKGIRSSNHPFSQHPLLAMYGEESAKGSYENTLKAFIRAYPQLADMPPQQMLQKIPQLSMRVMGTLLNLEKQHREELEQLAVSLVSQTWGIPEELLDGKIIDMQQMQGEQQKLSPRSHGQTNKPKQDMNKETDTIDREQVNKRITMNAMTQGAAVHNMATIHHAAKDQLEGIEPQLLQVYDKFSSASVHCYWIIDFANMTREILKEYAVGTSRVSFGEDDEEDDDEDIEQEYQEEDQEEDQEEYQTDRFDEPEEFNQNQPKVVARAINFPVLVQELVKGIMELLSMHALEGLSREQLLSIYAEADRLEDEPWLIQVGPQLWRAFLKIVPRGHELAEVVAEVAKQSPKYVHKLLSDTIEAVNAGQDPAEARAALQELMEGGAEEYGDEGEYEDDVGSGEEEEDWGLGLDSWK